MQLVIRDAVVAFVDADYRATYPSIPMVTDNAPFDWNDPPSPFTEFEVEFNWAHRISLGGSLKSRFLGFVYVTVRTAPGQGVRTSLGVLDWFSAKLGEAALSATGYKITMNAARPAPCSPWQGWHGEAIKVEFRADPT